MPLLAAALAIAVPARAALNACTNPIASCPCAIKSPGAYTIAQAGLAVAAVPAGDCIRIAAPGVTLDLGSANITLPVGASPTSVGIHVMAGAASAVVEGAAAPAAPAIIQSFAIGIQADAPNVSLENLTAQGNEIGIKIDGSAAYGSALSVLDSSHAGIVVIRPGAGPYLTGVSVSDTRGPGIKLNNVQGALLSNITVTDSDTFGVWLRASSYNVVTNFSVSRNTSAGIYLGCFNGGVVLSRACDTVPPTPPSHGNILTAIGADPSAANGPIEPNQAYGVVIGEGNNGNRVAGVSGSGNGTDAADYNPNCGRDLWTGNQFDTTIPPGPATCIH